jgi:hypothetical protein
MCIYNVRERERERESGVKFHGPYSLSKDALREEGCP